MAAQVARDARPGNPPDLGGDFLDHDHQREAEDERPRDAIAELGADLAASPDPARIIVGGAGN